MSERGSCSISYQDALIHAESAAAMVFEKAASKLASNFSVLVFVGGVAGLAVVVGFLYQTIGRKNPVTKSPHSLQARIDLERKYTRIFVAQGSTTRLNLYPVSADLAANCSALVADREDTVAAARHRRATHAS